jgi:hypothetical protein
MNSDVLMGFVVDRSASMMPMITSTVEGFNKLADEQRNQPGVALLSLTLFGDDIDVRYVAKPLHQVPAMTAHTGPNPYVIKGSTALYDAVGATVKGIEKWQSKHPDFDGQVKIIVFTDGEENSSTTWHLRQPTPDNDPWDLGGLLRWKQSEGWEFVFLGAGGSKWLERKFQPFVPQEAIYGYDHSDSANKAAYAGVSNSVTWSRATGQTVSSTMPRTVPPTNR